LGDGHKAIEFHEQALLIDREIGNRKGEGTDLNNLGVCYGDFLGDARKAIEFYEQAFVIDSEIKNKYGEGIELSNLGLQYSNLGEYDEALDYYYRALQNA